MGPTSQYWGLEEGGDFVLMDEEKLVEEWKKTEIPMNFSLFCQTISALVESIQRDFRVYGFRASFYRGEGEFDCKKLFEIVKYPMSFFDKASKLNIFGVLFYGQGSYRLISFKGEEDNVLRKILNEIKADYMILEIIRKEKDKRFKIRRILARRDNGNVIRKEIEDERLLTWVVRPWYKIPEELFEYRDIDDFKVDNMRRNLIRNN